MKELNNNERVNRATSNCIELMDEILNLKHGEGADFNYIKSLIRQIHKDQLELIELLEDYQIENDFKCDIDKVEIPSFIQKVGA